MKRILINLVPMSLVGIVCLSTVVNAQTTRRSDVAAISTTSAGDEPATASPPANVNAELASVFEPADEPAGFSPLQFAQARSAFGVNFQAASTPQLPSLMLHSEISEKERQELTEDLQVLSTLLEKSVTVSGSRQPAENRVLGVRVQRSNLPVSISYLQDFGIQFRLQTSQLSFAKSADSSGQSEEPTDASKETDWDIARRELLADVRADFAVAYDPIQAAPSVRHDEKNVEAIVEQVTKALDNIGRIRFPASAVGTKQIVSVCLTCPADGSVLSIRKSIQYAADPKDSTLEAVTTHRYIDPAAKQSDFASHQFLYAPATTMPAMPALPPRVVTPIAPTSPVEPAAPSASATSPAPASPRRK